MLKITISILLAIVQCPVGLRHGQRRTAGQLDEANTTLSSAANHSKVPRPNTGRPKARTKRMERVVLAEGNKSEPFQTVRHFDDWIQGTASEFLDLGQEPCALRAGKRSSSCRMISQKLCKKGSIPLSGLGGPPAKCFKKHKTCAVVGSSHHLLNASFGGLIDKHVHVIRINAAPDGSDPAGQQFFNYGPHVGQRTDARFVNMYGHMPTNMPRPTCLFLHEPKIPDSCGRYCWRNPGLCNVPCDGPGDVPGPSNICTNQTCEVDNLPCVGWAMDDDHDWGHHHVFVDNLFSGLADQVVPHSTAGFKAVIYAMTICDSVTVVGFGPSCSDSVGAKYYPSDLTGFAHSSPYGWHHYNEELMLLVRAAELGVKAIVPPPARKHMYAKKLKLLVPPCAMKWKDRPEGLHRHVGYCLPGHAC